MLLKADKKGELDDEDLGPDLVKNRYISASLYDDRQGVIASRSNGHDMPVEIKPACVLALLTGDGALSIYSLPDLNTRLYHYEGVQFLPSRLSHTTPQPRHWKNAEALSEVLVADLGDENEHHTYLLFRTSSGDVAIYDPFIFKTGSSCQRGTSALGLRRVMLRRVGNTLSESDSEKLSNKSRPMKTASVNGRLVVLVPGQSPAMVAKVPSSSPRVYNLSTGAILDFSGLHTGWCPQGFTYLGQDNNLVVSRLSPDVTIGHSDWVQQKVELGVDVGGIAFLNRTQSYVLATSKKEDFQLPQDDEWHADWKNEDASCLPQLERGMVKLLSSSTFQVIDSYELEHAERAMCIKSMNLEISEETHERKDLIVVGTAITKGEDVVARGAIYIFDVVDVVPQPGVPESDLKLKLVAKEEVKGAVTSICQIGSQGFLLAAQGQKCMVRGLKEDLSILPVAFMDMKYYVNVAKELVGTGLCILGDAMNGLWFVGYSVSLYDHLSSRQSTEHATGRTIQATALWP